MKRFLLLFILLFMIAGCNNSQNADGLSTTVGNVVAEYEDMKQNSPDSLVHDSNNGCINEKECMNISIYTYKLSCLGDTVSLPGGVYGEEGGTGLYYSGPEINVSELFGLGSETGASGNIIRVWTYTEEGFKVYHPNKNESENTLKSFEDGNAYVIESFQPWTFKHPFPEQGFFMRSDACINGCSKGKCLY